MSEGFTEGPENMEDGSVGDGKSWECSDPTRDNPGACEMDPFTAICKCDSWGQCERQPGNDGGKHWSFSETRRAAVGATSPSHSPIALLASRMDTVGLMVCRPQNKKDSVLFHHVWQRSQSLDDLQMPNSDLGDHKVYAFSDPKIHGAGDDTVSHKLQETLVWDAPEICSINAMGQKQCQLNREEVSASIARQRSPSWVLLEHADCSGNTNCEISAFDGDYTPQLVTDTLKTGSLERLDVHSCERDNWSLDHLVTDAHKTGSHEHLDVHSRKTDNLSLDHLMTYTHMTGSLDSLDVHSYETDNLNLDHLETDMHKTDFTDHLDVHSCEADNLNLDHLSLHVGRSGGQGKSTCVRSKEEDEQCSCPSEGFLGATCVDMTEVAPDYNTSDSCRESPTGNALMLSSPQVNCAEMTYTGSSSEGSICDGLTYSAEYAADNDVACAIAVSAITSCSPESTSSTESLFDSLTEYDGAMISDNATDTTPCPAVAPRCSTGAESGSRADSIAENVCSPRSVGSSSGAVSCMESRFSTETEHCTSPMTICRNNMGNVVKRRPTSLQVTPVYVHKGLPTVEDSVPSELEPEDTSRQRPEVNKTIPVLRVPHCDDRSSTPGSRTCRANRNRYSWPASQSVQLRSRSCSRLRRKHVKSAIMTSTADSLGTVGLSRRFHSQQLPLTKSASFGHTLFQNVHWGCPMTSARQVDSRKSEKFIMSLQKDGVIKPRLQQRCRHKRHSYHVTTGPCVTCTNHTNSLGPCFVLGIGQCHLCSDSSQNIAIKKNNDHPLVELEYVVPKSKNKTREAKTKAVEPIDMAVRNEMLQYTREKLGQRSKEDLVVLVEHFSRQARVVSEELVRLLQQKHDYIEQIEMRKIAIEQLLRLQMETK